MTTSVCTPLKVGSVERDELLTEYMRYLDRRDGETAADGETLARREESLARLRAQKVRFTGEVDLQLFNDQYQRFSHSRKTPPELMLLLAFVKINSHEAFAVDAVTRIRKHIPAAEKRVINQERYHTQLLLSAADLFGVPVTGAALPPRTLKVMVAGLARTPSWIMHPVTMAAELLGVASFKRLLTATRRVLRHQPELRDAMEERVMEVFTDEVGHLSYNRLRLGASGMAAVKLMLPALLTGFKGTLPELDLLCGGPMTAADVAGVSFEDMPQAARDRAFVA